MIERTTRALTEEEREKLAAMARGWASRTDLAITILWEAAALGLMSGLGILTALLGVFCFLAAPDGWVAVGLRLLGLCLIGFALALILTTVNRQVKAWKAWRTRRRDARDALDKGSATLTRWNFHLAFRVGSAGRNGVLLYEDLLLLSLPASSTLAVTWPDCFLPTDLTRGLEFAHAGPFELAVRPFGAPLPTESLSEEDCNPVVLKELLALPASSDLPPGWRLLDEPFDALLARLRGAPAAENLVKS